MFYVRCFWQTSETSLSSQEGRRRKAPSEEPADHLGCPLRRHPFFVSYFVFLNPTVLQPKTPRTHSEM